MSERRIVRAMIHGSVQGVGFRFWTKHQAELHGLQGFVRNRRDGTVEMLLAGPPASIETMLKACRTGPRGSRVDDVAVQDEHESALSEARDTGFSVLPTM